MDARLIDGLSVTQVMIEAQQLSTTGILYNGGATTTSAGTGIDTQDYDEAIIVVNKGAFAGSASVALAVYENTSDASTGSSAVSGADFTTVTSANDQSVETMFIRTAGRQRYLWLRSNKTGTTDTALIGATIILGKKRDNPPSNSPVASV